MATTEATLLEIEKYARMMRRSECFTLGQITRAVARLYDQMLKPAGLNIVQFGILRVCCQQGTINIARLAADLTMNRSTVTRNLKPLVQAGLVERKRSTVRSDVLLSLNDQGRKALASAIAHWDAAQKELIGRFGEVRWRQLDGDLSALAGLQLELG